MIPVLEPHNVVLTEVTAGLNLDDFKRDPPGIGEPMHGPDGNENRLVLMHKMCGIPQGHFGRAADHNPMFGAVKMALQRQLRPR